MLLASGPRWRVPLTDAIFTAPVVTTVGSTRWTAPGWSSASMVPRWKSSGSSRPRAARPTATTSHRRPWLVVSSTSARWRGVLRARLRRGHRGQGNPVRRADPQRSRSGGRAGVLRDPRLPGLFPEGGRHGRLDLGLRQGGAQVPRRSLERRPVAEAQAGPGHLARPVPLHAGPGGAGRSDRSPGRRLRAGLAGPGHAGRGAGAKADPVAQRLRVPRALRNESGRRWDDLSAMAPARQRRPGRDHPLAGQGGRDQFRARHPDGDPAAAAC